MRLRLLAFVLLASSASAQSGEACAPLGRGLEQASLSELQALVVRCPGYTDASGSAAFALGTALTEAGEPSAAVSAWASGRRALADRGLTDPRLDAAYVQAVFDTGTLDRQPEAAEVYLSLLELAGAVPDALLRPWLDELALIVPHALADQFRMDTLTPDGPGLAAWWRGRDPLPATAVHERLVEHLQRAATARQLYAPDGELDERGKIYIRFGPPTWTDAVTLEGGEFARYVSARIPSLRPSDFPRNEVWAYPLVDESAVYLFVETSRGRYREGAPEDLIPRSLRTGLGQGSRGRRKADALIFALNTLLRQLSHLHGHFASASLDVARYADVLDQSERESLFDTVTPDRIEDESSNSVTRTLSAPRSGDLLRASLPQPPAVFAQTALGRSTASALEFQGQRDARVPTARTAVLDDVEALPVACRVTRFLSPAGTTRTEVMWAIEPAALAERGPVYIGWHLVQMDRAFRPTARHREDLVVEAGATEIDAFPPQIYEVDLPTDGGHLALEWDARPLAEREAGEAVSMGPLFAVASARVDSLRTLLESGLEMSDLRPSVTGVDEPYPYVRVTPGEALSLYFEIYGLKAGAQNALFQVTYQVIRRRQGRIFRRSQEDVTDGRLTTNVVGERASEYLNLYTTDWAGADEVEVVIGVQDRRTSATVERSIRFEIAPAMR